MDREKRRSEEEEKELDRRIALIREKNQQIEQRTKEIEEDRARNEDSTAKSPKSSTLTQPKATTPDRNSNGQWSREWDKGKTPAETWRENVPSMDLKGRLAGQNGEKNAAANNNNVTGDGKGGRRGGRGNGGQANGQKNQGQKVEGVKIPSRLEGRISFPKQEEKEGNGGGKRGHHGKDGAKGGSKGDQEKKKAITDGEAQKGQRRRSGQKEQKDNKEQKEVKEQKQPKKEKENKKVQPAGDKDAEDKKKGKHRQRRESDNYAVRKVVHRMVEKICWIERTEKRKAKNELLGEQEELEEEPKSEDEIGEENTPPPVQEEQEEKEITSETAPEVEITPEDTEPASEPKDEAASQEAPKTPEPVNEETSAQEVKEDSNQNVITLVPATVITMTTSQIA